MNELSAILSDHRPTHTAFQCRHFITAKAGACNYGMYRQALRELDSRTWGLAEDALAIREAELDAEAAEREAAGAADRVEAERAELKRDRALLRLARLKRDVPDRCREWAIFYAQARELRGRLHIGAGETLDAVRREQLEEDMHVKQLASLMLARIEAGERPVDSSIAEALRSLPDGPRAFLLSSAIDPDLFRARAQGLLDAAPEPPAQDRLLSADAALRLAVQYVEQRVDLLPAGTP